LSIILLLVKSSGQIPALDLRIFIQVQCNCATMAGEPKLF
jgi:hypothetical protein